MINKTTFNFKDENILSFNTYTNELLDSILTAKCISLNKEINTLELVIGLIINSKLIQKVLDINKDNILNLKNLIAYNFKKKQNKNIILKNLWFSKKALILLKYTEWAFKIPNTLGLFYLIYLYSYDESIIPLFKILNKNIRNIFIGINEKYIMSRETIVIPTIFKNIITPVSFEYTSLVGRVEEGTEIINILNRTYNRNPIIIGSLGEGKSKLIEKIAFNLHKKIFLYLNISQLIQQFKNNNYILFDLISFIEKNTKIILIIKDIELLFDSSLPYDLLCSINKFIESLKKNKIQLIGTINSKSKYTEVLNKFNKLNFLLSEVQLKEFSENEIIEILEWETNEFNIKYKTKLNYTQSNFKDIYKLSKAFIKHIPSPIKEIFVLDSIFSKHISLTSYKSNVNLNITKSDIIEAIMNYTTIPVSFINTSSNSSNILNKLTEDLHNRIFGQDNAIEKITSSIKRAFTGLKETNKPIGSWLLCGPSGTGKTELVKSLAATLFGSESNLIRFDMSEFKEAHDSVKLIGCPPGYVGYDKGGILTSAVKEKPYSVILFDEIEKAHQNVNDLMLQLLDEGTLTDSYGEKFDFSNTIIIFTSNLGCPKNTKDFLFKSIQNGHKMSQKEYDVYKNNITNAIKNYFRPELLNRLSEVLIFNPLTKEALLPIADKYISNIQNKLIFNNIPLYLEVEENYLKLLIKDIFNPLYGARPLKRKIEETIENPISDILSLGALTESYKLSILINDKIKNSLNKTEICYMYSPLNLNKKDCLISNINLNNNILNDYNKQCLIKKNLNKYNTLKDQNNVKNTYYNKLNVFYISNIEYKKNTEKFKCIYNTVQYKNKQIKSTQNKNIFIEKKLNTCFHVYK